MFSSVERGGEDYDDQLTLDRLAKVQIERHIKSMEDLRWTYVFCGIDFLQKKVTDGLYLYFPKKESCVPSFLWITLMVQLVKSQVLC